jgi:hypothetical protein
MIRSFMVGSKKQIIIQSIDKKAMVIMKGFLGDSNDNGLTFDVIYRFDERTPLFLNGIRYKLEECAEFMWREKIMRTHQAVASRCGAHQTDTKNDFLFISPLHDFDIFLNQVHTIIKEGKTEAALFDKYGGLDNKEISLKLKKLNEKESGIYVVYNTRFSNVYVQFEYQITFKNKYLRALYRTGKKICKKMVKELAKPVPPPTPEEEKRAAALSAWKWPGNDTEDL